MKKQKSWNELVFDAYYNGIEIMCNTEHCPNGVYDEWCMAQHHDYEVEIK